MTQALFDIQPLLPALADNQPVLTPNNRLRNQMHQAYGEHCQTPVIATPPIYSLNEWLEQQWQRLQARGYEPSQRVTLNTLQANELWRQVVEASDFVPVGTTAQQLIRQLAEAHRHLTLWAIPDAALAPDNWSQPPPDSQPEALPETLPETLLLHWLDDFAQRLSQQQAITPEQRHAILLQAYQDGQLAPLPQLWLQSFDDMAPVTEQLLNHAARQVSPAPESVSSSMQSIRTACSDLTEELSAAARWSWQLLQTDPQARIGIVVPSLGQSRQLVERVFTDYFEPQLLAPETPRYALPFNISAGTPLASAPLIHHTLLLLQLNRPRLSRQQWLLLLHSPFFGDETAERLARCELQRRIQQSPREEISGTQIRDWLQAISDRLAGDESPPVNCPLSVCPTALSHTRHTYCPNVYNNWPAITVKRRPGPVRGNGLSIG